MAILRLETWRRACERARKVIQIAPVVLCLIGALTAPALVVAQPDDHDHDAPAGEPAAVQSAAVQPEHTEAAGDHAAGAEAAHEAPHGRGIIDDIARLLNFAILAGTLVYLLRSPIAGYLKDRSQQIRSDLVAAAETKQAAAAQIEEIQQKMSALPGELEALRAQGAREVAAEEERIRAAATAERERLLEQTRREIDVQVKLAERELVNRAADLSVALASERIKHNITDDDQQRLIDRYVRQLKG